jgi:hypothetical protein
MPKGRRLIIAFSVVTCGQFARMRDARKDRNGNLLRGAYGGDIRPSVKAAPAWVAQLFTTTTEMSDEFII